MKHGHGVYHKHQLISQTPMDALTRQIIAFHVGDRSCQRASLVGKDSVGVSSTGHILYRLLWSL